MFVGRQLPSWMQKSNCADHVNILEVKEKINGEDSVAADNKGVKHQKKIQRMQHDTGSSLCQNKSRLLKKCESRSKRKLIKLDDDQDRDMDGSGQEKKDSIRVCKRSQQGVEQDLLDKCETSKRKRISNKQPRGRADGICESDVEKKINIAAKERHQLGSRRKKLKENNLLDQSQDEVTKSIGSDDELTMEDLISIAEEYMNSEREKELQKLQKLGFESEVKPPYAETSKIGSEKGLTDSLKNRISTIDKPQSTCSSVTKPLLGGTSITNPTDTGDPAQDMLDLFLGPLLKTIKK